MHLPPWIVSTAYSRAGADTCALALIGDFNTRRRNRPNRAAAHPLIDHVFREAAITDVFRVPRDGVVRYCAMDFYF